MASRFWEKSLFGKTFFTSVLTIAREMPKTKGKNPGKICQLISENIPRIKQTMTFKLYIQLHI